MARADEVSQIKARLKEYVEGQGRSPQTVNFLIDVSENAYRYYKDRELCLMATSMAKEMLKSIIEEAFEAPFDIVMRKVGHLPNELIDLWWEILRHETPYLLESHILYMERKREYAKKFYEPRRQTLKVVVEDLQRLDDDPNIKFYGLSMPSRVGKALAYDTPVLTRNGWKNHGDLTIRDEVIGLDGEFKKILAIHNPCEMEYKVTFSDGESVVCHGNHEWYVWDRRTGEYGNVETKVIAKKPIEKDGHARYMLPPQEIVSGSHKALWVDPYTLGAWLGDGRNTNPDICGDANDYAIVQKIIDNGYPMSWETTHSETGVRYYGFKTLRQDLQHYDMCHSRRKSPKHIPDEYLVADEEQRLELLAGLLDTDGSLRRKEHRYSFSTSDYLLMQDVVSLVHTFGWRTCVTKYDPTTSSSGITARRPYYVVSFNPTMFIPCVLERKQLHEFSEQRRISIEKVEKITNHVMGNCITVEGGIYCVGKTLKPTHNSTICLFFLTWVACKKPNSHNAMGGHAGTLVKGFYKELLNFIVSEEYTFVDIFAYQHPNRVCLRDKSAEDYTITLDRPDRFATITCRGIDATWTGAVDVSKDGYLYVDDLVRDRQHSLSPTRMEETYQEYLNKMVDRKNDGAKELMVGTLWNVLDPLERIRKQFQGDPRYIFRRIPALDDNDESNFDYEINGFSTQYYREMRERLDNAEWMAKYQQQPFVREGLLFASDTLRYCNGIIQDETRRVIATCDPAFGGGDSLSCPICLETLNGSKYIIGWVHNKGTQKTTIPLLVSKIVEHHITLIQLERNNGGKLFAENLQKALAERNIFFCKVVTRSAPNKMAKEDKISGYSDYIKDNFIFLMPVKSLDLDKDVLAYKRDAEYQQAMDELTMYTAEGKNTHDDAPDAITQLAMFYEVATNGQVKAIQNPFMALGGQ